MRLKAISNVEIKLWQGYGVENDSVWTHIDCLVVKGVDRHYTSFLPSRVENLASRMASELGRGVSSYREHRKVELGIEEGARKFVLRVFCSFVRF